MFGLGVPELLVILIIGLVLFGPGKLPGVGKALGQSIREFKKETQRPEDDKTIDVAAAKKDEAAADKKSEEN
jgi:sec-independent protein translocase protein TatA